MSAVLQTIALSTFVTIVAAMAFALGWTAGVMHCGGADD